MGFDEALECFEQGVKLLRMGTDETRTGEEFPETLALISERFGRTREDDILVFEYLKDFLGRMEIALAEIKELIRRYKALNTEEVEPNELAQRVDAFINEVDRALESRS